MAVYNEQVYQDFTTNCSADISAAANYLDGVLTSGSRHDQDTAKALLYHANYPWLFSDPASMSNAELSKLTQEASRLTNFEAGLFLAAFISNEFQSYGFEVDALPQCNAMEQFDPSTLQANSLKDLLVSVNQNRGNARISVEGIAAKHGDGAAFAAIVYTIGKKNIDLQNSLLNSNTTTSASDNSQSWIWQTCSEYGYYQVADTSSKYNLVSRFINVANWETENCKYMFGYPQMPAKPDVSLPNKYGGWQMNPSNVMFTNGLK